MLHMRSKTTHIFHQRTASSLTLFRCHAPFRNLHTTGCSHVIFLPTTQKLQQDMSSQDKYLCPHLATKHLPDTTTFIHRFALHHGLQPFPTHFNTLSMEHKLSSTWNHATASSSQDTYGQMQLKPTAVEKHRFMFFPRGDNNTHCSSRMPSDAGGTRDLLTWRRGIIFLSYGMVPHWHAASRPERREEHLNRNSPVNTLEK